MAEIKKTVEQPLPWLEREFISLSESDKWNEAVKEWEMKSYYFVSGYKLCSYTLMETHSLCVLVNNINSKEIEICSSYAEIYFGIPEGNRIEPAVSKIRRNNEAEMGEDALNYLMKHGIINSIEREDYRKDISFDDDESQEHKEEMNRRLINFTDYENKEAFDKINLILAWASDNREWSLGYIATLKFNLLHFELVDMRYLDDVIRKKSIDEKYCDYKKHKAGMQLLWEYFNSISIKRLLPPKYIKRSIPECEKIVIVEEDIENDIRRFEVEDFDLLVGDVWDKPVSQYMSEDTLDSIARITEGWGRISIGCKDYSLVRFVHFWGFEELLNIYRENPGIDSFRDYVDLLSMRQIDTMFNQFVIVTFNRFPVEALIQELNNIFSKEGIRVRYSDLDLRFISMI